MEESELVAHLSQSNLQRLNRHWREERHVYSRNVAYLDGRNIPLERIAYHVGIPNQKVLTASFLTEKLPEVNLGGVFFSTSLGDLEFYLEEDKDAMVYFADLKEAMGRVQIVYKHKVMFQDDIRVVIGKLLDDKASKQDLQEARNTWLRKYTQPLNPNRSSRIKNRGDYVILDAPIIVKSGYPAQ